MRKIEFPDAEIVLDWENNIDGWNMEEKPRDYSIYDIILLISEMQDVHKSKQLRFMICHEDFPVPIGAADLTGMDFEDHSSGVGILIADPEMRHRGFASKALLLLEEKAREWGLTKLRSTILENNDSSLHLFEKLGYKKLADSGEGYVVEGTYIKALVFEKWLSA